MAIPQIFHVIPNPYQIPVPTSSVSGSHANSPPSLCKSDYPNVLNWDRKDHRTADSDLTRIADDDDDTPSKLDFLVHKDGTPFTGEEIKPVRKQARAAFQTMLDDESLVAPPTWSQASSTATNWFRNELLNFCPLLALCSNHWKVDALATEVYAQWSRNRKDAIAEQSKQRKRKSAELTDEKSSKRARTGVKESKERSKEKKKKKQRQSTPAPSLDEDDSSIYSDVPHPIPNAVPNHTPAAAPTSALAPATTIEVSNPSSAVVPARSSPLPMPHNLETSPLEKTPSVSSEVSQTPPVKVGPTMGPPKPQITDPLSGIFGNTLVTPSRLTSGNDKPPAAEAAAAPTPPPPTTAPAAEPIPAPAPALTSAPAPASAPTASDERAVPSAPVTEPSKTVKPKPHKPGAPNTAWNLFARDHMAKKGHSKDTHQQVKEAFENLTPESKKLLRTLAYQRQSQDSRSEIQILTRHTHSSILEGVHGRKAAIKVTVHPICIWMWMRTDSLLNGYRAIPGTFGQYPNSSGDWAAPMIHLFSTLFLLWVSLCAVLCPFETGLALSYLHAESVYSAACEFRRPEYILVSSCVVATAVSSRFRPYPSSAASHAKTSTATAAIRGVFHRGGDALHVEGA
ncbi:hypothetical protein B0H11DRAFT_2188946 [Mycena galericulata]|nr:hypothetical protein B0H11DRAFT_2188946 [Mycena galericulata]